jgi:tRNA(Ile)-lysidine synthetase-like protein
MTRPRGCGESTARQLRADAHTGAARRGVPAALLERLLALDDVTGRIVVGCSGGADSLALLALLRAEDRPVTAVYVDHGLRPGVPDERIVAVAAEQFGADFHVARVEVAPGSNLEARARDARYAALEEQRRRAGAEVIAVGHTRDDQAETVLLNFLRGSGTKGLAGMVTRRGCLCRPLLDLRRAETRELCARLRLVPADDAMNAQLRFRRVWLRREVIPMLEAGADRDLVDVLARQASVLHDDDELLDAQARTIAGAASQLDAADLVATPHALARRIVRQWLGEPPAGYDQVEAVLALARGGRGSVQLPGSRRVERAGGRMVVISAPVESPAPATLAVPGRVAFGPFDLEAWIEHASPVAWPDGRNVAVLDADRVGPTVHVVPPHDGARFLPLGRSGTKRVRDALREAGIASSARSVQPVLLDSARSVCWVVGYRIGEHVKVTARTRRFLWVSAEKMVTGPRTADPREDRGTS